MERGALFDKTANCKDWVSIGTTVWGAIDADDGDDLVWDYENSPYPSIVSSLFPGEETDSAICNSVVAANPCSIPPGRQRLAWPCCCFRRPDSFSVPRVEVNARLVAAVALIIFSLLVVICVASYWGVTCLQRTHRDS